MKRLERKVWILSQESVESQLAPNMPACSPLVVDGRRCTRLIADVPKIRVVTWKTSSGLGLVLGLVLGQKPVLWMQWILAYPWHTVAHDFRRGAGEHALPKMVIECVRQAQELVLALG